MNGKAEFSLRALFSRMKDSLLLGGWIGGILLLGGLLWFFTQSLQTRSLQHAVNRILGQMEDPRRLGEPLSRRELKSRVRFRGSWYTRADSEGRVLIFSITLDGIRIPCAAMLSPGGQVEEVLPLSLSGEKRLNRISPGILKTYIRRIEGGAES